MAGMAFGFTAAPAGLGTFLQLTNSVVAGNLVGLRVNDARSQLTVGGSTITNNGTNLIVTNGAVITWGNNYQTNNGTTNPFTLNMPLQ